jgi:hypothetical protein
VTRRHPLMMKTGKTWNLWGEGSVHSGKGPLRAGNSERETTGLSAPIGFFVGYFSWVACGGKSVTDLQSIWDALMNVMLCCWEDVDCEHE